MNEFSHLGLHCEQRHWPFPKLKGFQGQYMSLEPMRLSHLDDLWRLAQACPASFNYLRYGPFDTKRAFQDCTTDLMNRSHQPFWTVLPHEGKASGWISLCDVEQEDGSIEIGSIWFAPPLQGTHAAREALFALMCYAMDDLGYERLVWRCQVQNAKSFRAAERFGFQHEGTWRKAIIVDGWQRDVAWFSILKDEWPARRAALSNWLHPENFDLHGQQKAPLG